MPTPASVSVSPRPEQYCVLFASAADLLQETEPCARARIGPDARLCTCQTYYSIEIALACRILTADPTIVQGPSAMPVMLVIRYRPSGQRCQNSVQTATSLTPALPLLPDYNNAAALLSGCTAHLSNCHPRAETAAKTTVKIANRIRAWLCSKRKRCRNIQRHDPSHRHHLTLKICPARDRAYCPDRTSVSHCRQNSTFSIVQSASEDPITIKVTRPQASHFHLNASLSFMLGQVQATRQFRTSRAAHWAEQI